jgi:hypothetical protein
MKLQSWEKNYENLEIIKPSTFKEVINEDFTNILMQFFKSL